MAQDPISAAGTRLEALLRAQETRGRTLRPTSDLQPASSIPFVLPDGTKQFAYEPTGHVDSNVPNVTPPVSAESGVGATFRRKGVLSDVPMTVSRVGDGVVFTTFGGSNGPEEMTFAADQIDLVTKAPGSEPFVRGAFYQDLATMELDLSKSVAASTTATPGASAPTAPVAAPAPATATSPAAIPATVPAAAPATSPATSPATTSATAPATAPAAAPAYSPPIFDTAPIPFVLLPDGTRQFGYAPSGATNINLVPNTTPPVPTDFGVGATFRRHGVVQDTPMTVTRVGEGVVFANYTDTDGITHDMAFHPSQLDLLTAAS